MFGARWIPRSARFAVFGQNARGTGALEICKLAGGKIETLAKVSRCGASCVAISTQAYLLPVVLVLGFLVIQCGKGTTIEDHLTCEAEAPTQKRTCGA